MWPTRGKKPEPGAPQPWASEDLASAPWALGDLCAPRSTRTNKCVIFKALALYASEPHFRTNQPVPSLATHHPSTILHSYRCLALPESFTHIRVVYGITYLVQESSLPQFELMRPCSHWIKGFWRPCFKLVGEWGGAGRTEWSLPTLPAWKPRRPRPSAEDPMSGGGWDGLPVYKTPGGPGLGKGQ